MPPVIRSRPHLRNLVISAFAIAMVLVLATQSRSVGASPVSAPAMAPLPMPAQVGAALLTVTANAKSGTPSSTIQYDLTLTNVGATDDLFTVGISQSCNVAIPGCNESLSLRTVFLQTSQS